MPVTLVHEPNKTKLHPRNEALPHWLITSDYILTNAAAASVYVEFDGTSDPGGNTFTFLGRTFTTVATGLFVTATHNTIPIGPNAEGSAEEFRSMIEKNIDLFEKVRIEVTNPSGSIWRTTITWKVYGEIENWTFDYSGVAAIVGNSETNGTNRVVREGYKLLYQLFRDIGSGYSEAITDLEAVTPLVKDGVGAPKMGFDFQKDVLGLLETTFPELDETDVTIDDTFMLDCFLKYGGVQNDNCTITNFDFETSGGFIVVNAVEKVDVQNKLTEYNSYRVSGEPSFKTKFLTSRPSSMKVCIYSHLWLWWIGLQTQFPTYDKYRVRWDFRDANLTLLLAVYSNEITTDGVLIIPAGTANIPTYGTSAVYYDVTVEHYVADGFGGFWEDTSETRRYLTYRCNCDPLELYFQGDLGGFETIQFLDYEEITHLTEQTIIQNEIELPTDIHAASTIKGRLRAGGRQQVNTTSRIRYKAQLIGYDTEEYENYFRQFRDSERRLIKYTNHQGVDVARSIFVDPGDVTIRKEGEYLTLEVVFSYHTDLK